MALEPKLGVVIPVRNRAGIRLDNCLRSLRWQSVDPASVEIVISDFGSDDASRRSVQELAAEHGAKVFYTPTEGLWNRSRALNIGIQQVRAPRVLCTDADMVFADNFLETIDAALDRDPKVIVHCDCLDLPETTRDERFEIADLDTLRQRATRRTTGGTGACQAVRRDFLFAVRGYDEKYLHWGNEDLDMTSRARVYGLDVVWAGDQTFMLHQWHETTNAQKPLLRRLNYWRYVLTRRCVRKNPRGWGTL